MDMEIWKTSDDCDKIQVSNFGEVRTKPELLDFGDDNKQPFSSKLKPRKYGRYLYVNFNGRSYSVARLVAKAFVPNPKNLPIVVFLDGNFCNLSYQNLKWSSRQDAMKQNLASSNYKRSRGKSISVFCDELNSEYDNVKTCLADVESKLGVHINYDTVLRHLRKSDDVCLQDVHFHKQ